MSQQTVETVSSTADRLKVGLAIAVIVAGIVGFYLLAEQPTVVRVVSVIAGLVAGEPLPGSPVRASGSSRLQKIPGRKPSGWSGPRARKQFR